MARRRHRGMQLQRVQDPGKDLFAYLFLLIMVFSFVLMMSSEQRHKRAAASARAPEQAQPGKSALTTVSDSQFGRLVRQGEDIFIVFSDKQYRPKEDFEELLADGRISSITGKDGQVKDLLYLEDDKENMVLLTEYLKAFQFLSDRGVAVAFAEKQ